MNSSDVISSASDKRPEHLSRNNDDGDDDFIGHDQADEAVHAYPSRFILDLRGTRFEIDRDLLMSLPESIMVTMFPEGFVFGRHHLLDDEVGDGEESTFSEEEQVTYVDFDPECLEYILDFYRKAHENSIQMHQQEQLGVESAAYPGPFFGRTAIIILREELEFFAIPPPKSSSSSSGSADVPLPDFFNDITSLKLFCSQHLLNQRSIFDALQRNANKENSTAERHLIDLLCMSGFNRNSDWGYRKLDTGRTTLLSLALTFLRTNGDPTEVAASQKLLLFWKKPARKVWWEGVEVPAGENQDIMVRLWCRRTWTLECGII
ncbi:uncharacterized protein VTP21DRAFT_8747 [Calcarisporiella thermophila]|uniref:uncharacterized protein n=1 Tax=Calcarisporiella thermophila TaxID=911321 RepID=UPI0037429BF1